MTQSLLETSTDSRINHFSKQDTPFEVKVRLVLSANPSKPTMQQHRI
jgi:hypothetical protein